MYSKIPFSIVVRKSHNYSHGSRFVHFLFCIISPPHFNRNCWFGVLWDINYEWMNDQKHNCKAKGNNKYIQNIKSQLKACPKKKLFFLSHAAPRSYVESVARSAVAGGEQPVAPQSLSPPAETTGQQRSPSPSSHTLNPPLSSSSPIQSLQGWVYIVHT